MNLKSYKSQLFLFFLFVSWLIDITAAGYQVILAPKVMFQTQVVPNLYECVCSAEHKLRDLEESL